MFNELDFELSVKYRDTLLDVMEMLTDVLEDYPENNMGYDYLSEAQRFIGTVLDEYVVEIEN